MADQDTAPNTIAGQVSAIADVEVTPTHIVIPLLHPFEERADNRREQLPADPDRLKFRRKVLARDMWKIDADTEGERIGQLVAALTNTPLWIVERMDGRDWQNANTVVLAILSGKPIASTTTIDQTGS